MAPLTPPWQLYSSLESKEKCMGSSYGTGRFPLRVTKSQFTSTTTRMSPAECQSKCGCNNALHCLKGRGSEEKKERKKHRENFGPM
ncbi:hypothetical protein CCUS01_13944 [Colletotrichum cuscutae]|uniref:Uncharacterized protein n=1 Tax=Colletotrichum cuscutae TaxID=1209917 RepID=A0AAI9YAE9_9PEZI|nr:hypothetical protein CSPX01_06697 [Colletotrichum filicis]KAK1492948.1 hypothetical protein CCUS01_13944 [Colletotrichum cuscutae]